MDVVDGVVLVRRGGRRRMSAPVLAEEDVPLRIPMSRAEYDALPESRPRFEWVDGEAIELIAAVPNHGRTILQLAQTISSALPELELTTDAELQMPNSSRVPDLLVTTGWADDAKRITTAPLVAIEVLSPSTWREDVYRKPAEYGEFGVGQYWIVDCEERLITIQENVDGNWITTVELNDQNPIAEISVGDYGTITLDLNKIIR